MGKKSSSDLLLFLLFVSIVNSIKFSIVLQPHEVRFFREPASKGIRYQIDIMGSSPLYQLDIFQIESSFSQDVHAFEPQKVHSDARTEQEYKFFSAFAKLEGGVMIKLESMCDSPIQLQIEFYHGFYLQGPSSAKEADEFLSMTRKMQEMSQLIKQNYAEYKSKLLNRKFISERFYFYVSFTVLTNLMIITVVKIWYLVKVTKLMKTQKLI